MCTEPELDYDDLPRVDVIKRLRSRSQPITLFGETEQESRARLRRFEIEQVSPFLLRVTYVLSSLT